ncbi:hypothetical protein PCCS19_51650 [Paenibacillus sp. CCS19]|uniref:DUF402 domain-containing protein n=1 Tax=Paenibacillus sp. CCS19 TaxID=3158387 RepID=UPI00255DA071|nr:DUF402 domain-containing protein [Paenibacillus cellulosilyticus]GMK42106.1 hypothetical protein PCCS19_51650 [Paenibacillus cellulosilyticus]
MKLKRRTGDRADWQRVLEREYAQFYLETDAFQGCICLLKINKVREPLHATYGENKICIADEGYLWLQQIPSNEHYAVTTMYDDKGRIVQRYIDIIYLNGVGENGVPWVDDLFLDIVVLPSGELIHKDLDELDEALNNGSIDERLYDLAKQESAKLTSLIEADSFDLLALADEHKDFLIKKLRPWPDI